MSIQIQSHTLWAEDVLISASVRTTIFDLKRKFEYQKDINFRLMEREQQLCHWLEQEQENTERMSGFASKFQLEALEVKKLLEKEKQERIKIEGLVKSLRQELSKYKDDDDKAAQISKGGRFF